MGDPRKIRKKYDTPDHPWIKARIEDEKALSKEYGTRRKKEIWRAETVLKNFKSQAKHLIIATGEQAELETQHLYRRVKELGLTQEDISFDTILGLKVGDVLKRRLQSVMVARELARSPKQARQFITHGHVLVNGKKITSPSYLVKLAEEATISFSVGSSLFSEEHPERAQPEEVPGKQAPEAEKSDKQAEKTDEKASEKPSSPTEEKKSEKPKKEESDEAEPSEEKPAEDSKNDENSEKEPSKKDEKPAPEASSDDAKDADSEKAEEVTEEKQ